MSCQVSLGPNDDFEVITPSGRRVYLPISPYAIEQLWQLVWASTGERPNLSGPKLALEAEARRKAAWQKIEDENSAWNALAEQRRALAAETRTLAAAAKRKGERKVHGVRLADLDFTL